MVLQVPFLPGSLTVDRSNRRQESRTRGVVSVAMAECRPPRKSAHVRCDSPSVLRASRPAFARGHIVVRQKAVALPPMQAPEKRPYRNVTMINGQSPPEAVVPPQDQVQMLRTSDGRGNTILVARGRRPAHSRSPIHIHAYRGTTCVIEGQMTLYMEGMSPMTAQAGSCYFMPPGAVMSGANEGSTAAILIDSFTFPDGRAAWAPVEPNTASSTRQFDL